MRLLKVVPGALVLAAILTACADTPTTPDPAGGPSLAVTRNTKLPLGPFLFSNGCTGENLRFTGTRHQVVTSTSDGDGGIHITRHVNWQNLRGVGVTSGTAYRAQQVNNFASNVRPPFPSTLIEHVSLRFVAQKSNGEFRLKGDSKLVINGNGDVVLDEFTPTVLECR